MAAYQPPSWQPPSRRQARAAKPIENHPELDSRSERNRLRRERSMERRFSWLFITAVAATSLYLIGRTPWGLLLVHRYF